MFQSSNVIQSYIRQDIPAVFFSFAPTIQWYNQNQTTLCIKTAYNKW